MLHALNVGSCAFHFGEGSSSQIDKLVAFGRDLAVDAHKIVVVPVKPESWQDVPQNIGPGLEELTL